MADDRPTWDTFTPGEDGRLEAAFGQLLAALSDMAGEGTTIVKPLILVAAVRVDGDDDPGLMIYKDGIAGVLVPTVLMAAAMQRVSGIPPDFYREADG